MKYFLLLSFLLISVKSFADIAITATGVGVSQLDACQTAKSNLRLKTRGNVTGYGNCSCENNGSSWICSVDGSASK